MVFKVYSVLFISQIALLSVPYINRKVSVACFLALTKSAVSAHRSGIFVDETFGVSSTLT